MRQENRKARVIAFYLPQFHPIPENDKWWGKGFTEWTNVGKAKPLFKGHYQPRVPADLGYYDLRMPEVREAQAEMAREAGIEGFCYWHYWFGNGKQLLERPFNEVLASGKPDFPFCLGWANHSWTNKSWDVGTRKVKESVLMEMVYNEEEYIKHFYDVLPAFKDKRYITVDGKPLFLVFRPLEIPYPNRFIELWQSLAIKNGFKGVYFVGIAHNMLPQERNILNILLKNAPNKAATYYKTILNAGYDAVNSRGYNRADYYSRSLNDVIWRGICMRFFKYAPISKCDQKMINKYLYTEEDCWENVFPTLLPNWDRTARSGAKARIYTGSTPKVFSQQLYKVLDLLSRKKKEHQIAFLMSWNEWAEGNYVEPDLKYGHGYLDVLRECIIENK
ncbi:glycoside hydrolase family 99-like domain-containing protein [Parabacteroides sp. ZJ-118]|uniref:glycoside hydrolase family 99-like domain-containing protein n=1 Tax=Parabacteroides sp. ZJ-118 TaxID=2709398 RepID=UPI0013ED4670|nr:glycoside hydrolase family 99-like domain-containing protein [Parabacteroides sp. ZJ-118]